jgi:hypothetical protein
MPLGPLEDICEFRLYIIKRLFSQLQHSTILNNNYTTPVKKKSKFNAVKYEKIKEKY